MSLKPRNRQPEHALQVQTHKFAREAVACPHQFLAFDRARKMSPLQHIREKSRGLLSGTPDTLLLVPNLPPFWCELKAKGGTLTDNQRDMQARLRHVGCACEVAESVAEYHAKAAAAGVPFIPGAGVMAMRLDALLASESAGRHRKARPRAEREPRASGAGLAMLARLRAKGIYA